MGGRGDESRIKFWQSHIAAQRVSGKSVLRYAREQGLADHSLSYWKSKLSKPASSLPSLPSFTPVSGITTHQEIFITITVPSGITIKVPSTIPGEKLLEVVQCLVK